MKDYWPQLSFTLGREIPLLHFPFSLSWWIRMQKYWYLELGCWRWNKAEDSSWDFMVKRLDMLWDQCTFDSFAFTMWKFLSCLMTQSRTSWMTFIGLNHKIGINWMSLQGEAIKFSIVFCSWWQRIWTSNLKSHQDLILDLLSCFDFKFILHAWVFWLKVCLLVMNVQYQKRVADSLELDFWSLGATVWFLRTKL